MTWKLRSCWQEGAAKTEGNFPGPSRTLGGLGTGAPEQREREGVHAGLVGVRGRGGGTCREAGSDPRGPRAAVASHHGGDWAGSLNTLNFLFLSQLQVLSQTKSTNPGKTVLRLTSGCSEVTFVCDGGSLWAPPCHPPLATTGCLGLYRSLRHL